MMATWVRMGRKHHPAAAATAMHGSPTDLDFFTVAQTLRPG